MDVSTNSFSSLGSSGWELEGDLGRDALREICCSSLSRLLELDDTKLDTLLGGEEGIKREDSGHNIARNIATKLKALSQLLKHDSDDPESMEFPTLTFGSPINSDSQAVFLQLTSHMEEYSNEEGLFRKSGSHSRVEQLTNDLSTRPFHEIVSSGEYLAHDYASALKQYLSDLPEPLMATNHMEAYRQIAEFSEASKKTLCLQLLVLLLPPASHMALSHLLVLLSSVAKCQENKMDPHNLALIFTPSLFFSKTEPLEPQLVAKLVTLLEHMICSAEEVFEIPTEVRVVADRYMRRKGTEEDIPVDIYTSSCQRMNTGEDFHTAGKDRAAAELAQLYEYVQKMPEGPQKTHFLKRFEAGNKMPGTPTATSRAKRFKENFLTPKHTPKRTLPKGVGSHQVSTPMRPWGNGANQSKLASHKTVEIYATPLKPKQQRQVMRTRLESDV